MDDPSTDVPAGKITRPPSRRLTLGLLTHGAGDPNSHTVWAGVASIAQEREVNLICFPGKPLRSPLEFEAQSNILYEPIFRYPCFGVETAVLGTFCRYCGYNVKHLYMTFRDPNARLAIATKFPAGVLTTMPENQSQKAILRKPL